MTTVEARVNCGAQSSGLQDTQISQGGVQVEVFVSRGGVQRFGGVGLVERLECLSRGERGRPGERLQDGLVRHGFEGVERRRAIPVTNDDGEMSARNF